jgi:hypothetical protein
MMIMILGGREGERRHQKNFFVAIFFSAHHFIIVLCHWLLETKSPSGLKHTNKFLHLYKAQYEHQWASESRVLNEREEGVGKCGQSNRKKSAIVFFFG